MMNNNNGDDNNRQNAISESFQWDEDDVQTELGVMKELSEAGGHENVLFLHDSLGRSFFRQFIFYCYSKYE